MYRKEKFKPEGMQSAVYEVAEDRMGPKGYGVLAGVAAAAIPISEFLVDYGPISWYMDNEARDIVRGAYIDDDRIDHAEKLEIMEWYLDSQGISDAFDIDTNCMVARYMDLYKDSGRGYDDVEISMLKALKCKDYTAPPPPVTALEGNSTGTD